MIFLSKPAVYHLPGTWEKQDDVLIHHLNLTPDQGLILFFGLLLGALVAYGIFLDALTGNISVTVEELRPKLARAAFQHTAEYDAAIHTWFANNLWRVK